MAKGFGDIYFLFCRVNWILQRSGPLSPLLPCCPYFTLQGNPNRCVDVLSHSLMRLKVERVIEIIALSLL